MHHRIAKIRWQTPYSALVTLFAVVLVCLLVWRGRPSAVVLPRSTRSATVIHKSSWPPQHDTRCNVMSSSSVDAQPFGAGEATQGDVYNKDIWEGRIITTTNDALARPKPVDGSKLTDATAQAPSVDNDTAPQLESASPLNTIDATNQTSTANVQTLLAPIQRYPTTRTPPCTWASSTVKNLPLRCARVQGRIVGFSDRHSAPLRFPEIGLWTVEEKLSRCPHLDIWIIHISLFLSPHLSDAIRSLPNAPSLVVVDNSGEIGEIDECNCMFNELLKNRTIHGSSDITFVLASQASSLYVPGQKLFNQHWLVPRQLAELEQKEGPNSTVDELDRSDVNVTSSRMLCLGGYPRPHKVQFLGELDSKGLLDRMLWSGGTPDVWTGAKLEYMLKFYNYTEREISDGLRFRDKLPHVLDVDRGAKKAGSLTFRSALYSLARVHVVLESNSRIPSLDRQACSRTFRYTEKTLKAMYSGARFIILADPASLELLRCHGFRTFHPHINETYDIIPTYREKADAIHLEIARLLSLSDDAFNEMLERTQSIVDHNRKWLLSPDFFNMVKKQSFFAFGLSSEPAFVADSHVHAVDAMYESINLAC